jgi:hypothetical protein
MKLVHEIHNRMINAKEAADSFAATQGREVEWKYHSRFSFVNGRNIYVVSMTRTGWQVYLVTDGNTPEVTVTL